MQIRKELLHVRKKKFINRYILSASREAACVVVTVFFPSSTPEVVTFPKKHRDWENLLILFIL